MNDTEFFKKMVQTAESLYSGLPNKIFGIKDTSSIHRFTSAGYANLIGVTPEFIIDKPDSELPWDNGRFAQHFRKEDCDVMTRKQPQAYLKINNFTDGLKPRLFIKYPIINPETNNAIGTFYEGMDFSLLNLQYSSLNHQKLKSSKATPLDISDVILTKREKQIACFILLNFSSQEIADAISSLDGSHISSKTVDSIIRNQLLHKFHAVNRMQLCEAIRNSPYNFLYPEELLKKCSIPLPQNIFFRS
jgi:DNA-binding CsgD family transcriptional regulator